MFTKPIKLTILSICILASIYLISGEAKTHEIEFDFDLFLLTIIFLTHFLFILSHTKKFQIAIRAISNINIKYWPWVFKISSTRLLNNLIPQSGNALRAIELKHENSLSYTDYSISLLTLTWLDCVINLSIAIIIISISSSSYPILLILLITLFVILIAPKSLSILNEYFVTQSKNIIPLTFKYLDSKIKSLTHNKLELYKIGLLSSISFILMSIRLYFGFYITGQSVTVIELLVIHAIIKAVLLFSIIPGNILIQGFIAGMTTKLIGIGFTEGAIASVFLQICGYILLGAISLVSFGYELFKK